MQEVEFRAWDTKAHKYIYFDFNNIYGYEGETSGVVLPDGRTMLNHNSGYAMSGINEDLVIEQYIGLRDMYGKKIFEGDVVIRKEIDWDWVEEHPEAAIDECPKAEVMRDVVTMSRSPRLWLENEQFGYEDEDLEDPELCEVIGTIHDNEEDE